MSGFGGRLSGHLSRGLNCDQSGQSKRIFISELTHVCTVFLHEIPGRSASHDHSNHPQKYQDKACKMLIRQMICQRTTRTLVTVPPPVPEDLLQWRPKKCKVLIFGQSSHLLHQRLKDSNIAFKIPPYPTLWALWLCRSHSPCWESAACTSPLITASGFWQPNPGPDLKGTTQINTPLKMANTIFVWLLIHISSFCLQSQLAIVRLTQEHCIGIKRVLTVKILQSHGYLISQLCFMPELSQDLKQSLGLRMAWKKLAKQGSERNGFSLVSRWPKCCTVWKCTYISKMYDS